jgi:hypothetical protein
VREFAPFADFIIQRAFKGPDAYRGAYLGLVKSMYPVCPEAIHGHFDAIIDAIESGGILDQVNSAQLLQSVLKDKPDLALPHMQVLIDQLSNASLGVMVGMALQEVAAKFPKEFIPFMDDIVANNNNPLLVAVIPRLYGCVGRIDATVAKRVAALMTKSVESDMNSYTSPVILMELKTVATGFRDVVMAHMPLLRKVAKEARYC